MTRSHGTGPSGPHPKPELLERFMRNEIAADERRVVVRHLLTGCPHCITVTRDIWVLGAPALRAGRRSAALHSQHDRQAAPPQASEPQAPRHAADTGALGALRQIERQRQEAPRLVRRLLAGSPSTWAAAVTGRDADRLITPAVCEELLSLARDVGPGRGAGAGWGPGSGRGPASDWGGGSGRGAGPARGSGPAGGAGPASGDGFEDGTQDAPPSWAARAAPAQRALAAAQLAQAVAERLDPAVWGATVVQGLQARAWAHLGHARRMSGDLPGAAWALATAEALAAGSASPGEPQERAELLHFQAGLTAAQGDLDAANRLLARAVELYRGAAEPRRAASCQCEWAALRARMNDLAGAADLLRAAVELLDALPAPGAPDLVAGALHTLAALLLRTSSRRSDQDAAPAAPGAAALAGPPGRAVAHHEQAQDLGTLERQPPTLAGTPDRQAQTLMEALLAAQRAAALYHRTADLAAAADALRLQGQIQAALHHPEAEATLSAAAASLAQHGAGRAAVQAQVELALSLARQGRTGELRSLPRRPPLSAPDASWGWTAALLVFDRHLEVAPDDTATLEALACYLAPADSPGGPLAAGG